MRPSVCAVMLTRDRPEMAHQAVQCFLRQTYPTKRLWVLDTGDESMGYLGDYDGVHHAWSDLSLQSWSVGRLRNNANERAARYKPEILIHFDDDDWSHPFRIAEQVALLESSGADAVGYDDMIFWDGAEAWQYFIRHPGKALGTSLMYWAKTWERVPFQPFASGEDSDWCGRVKVATVSSIVGGVPRMIARIHAGNARNPAYSLAERQKNAALPYPLWQWRRAPEYDRILKETLP